MCLVEERVTQALETLRTFGWSFHKKIVGSSRWVERLGGTYSANLEGNQARLSGTSETSPAGCSWMVTWQRPVPCHVPQPFTWGGNMQSVLFGQKMTKMAFQIRWKRACFLGHLWIIINFRWWDVAERSWVWGSGPRFQSCSTIWKLHCFSKLTLGHWWKMEMMGAAWDACLRVKDDAREVLSPVLGTSLFLHNTCPLLSTTVFTSEYSTSAPPPQSGPVDQLFR